MASAWSRSKSPTRMTSTLAGSNWFMTAARTSSRVSSGGGDMERKRRSAPRSWARRLSWAQPSMDLRVESCCCSRPRRARPRASSSQRKAPGSRILWASWRAASRPPQPPVRGAGVGNWKSTKMASSVQVTSTMMSRSTQKSSTCSRLQGAKAPPSWRVRAPRATAPCFSPAGSTVSRLRPPAATMRSAPRWASWGRRRMRTRAPLPRRRARTPMSLAAWSSSWKAATAGGVATGGASRRRSRRPAMSSSLMRALGTTSSGSGSIGSVAALLATSRRRALSMTTGVPSERAAGEQATMAEGSGVPGLPKSVTWAQRSAATALTSSRVTDSTAARVAAWAVWGSMKVCSQATVSMRWVSCSPWASWSPIAASCSESVMRAWPKRSSSEAEMP
mmetsp:Transcript_5083/g.15370  ORF Transcript_5083/g.15370 Transcript_5083/m.15370 type:complete len:391 (-) Transcript_5083:1542-2714(-)